MVWSFNDGAINLSNIQMLIITYIRQVTDTGKSIQSKGKEKQIPLLVATEYIILHKLVF